MTNLMADIAANPIGAVLVLIGSGLAVLALATELRRYRRPRKPPMIRADLIGHAMNRTKYGRH